jgi:hypothetical protein
VWPVGGGGVVGGLVINQNMWDDQGLKNPCFLELFYKNKIMEKSLFYEGEIGFIEKPLNEG